jgi:hypothetical protein
MKRRKKKATAPEQPPSDNPQILQPAPNITELEEFQAAYGDKWRDTIRTPWFNAAMLLLNSRKLKFIESLTNEEIEKFGNIVLADLRGHLNHEHDLATLHMEREQMPTGEEEVEYFPPEAIVEIEEKKKEIREKLRRQYYAT